MPLLQTQRAEIDRLVSEYKASQGRFEDIREVFVDDIERCKELRGLLHSVKSRVKEPTHLREKIIRKSKKYFTKSGRFKLTSSNLPFMVNDLVGVRLIHLYTKQFEFIDDALRQCLDDNNYVLREGPIARVWDSEQREYYASLDIETLDSPSLYSSVHYVISTSDDKKGSTIEIQVRTLADELWGEVEHLINYPKKSGSVECREQIAVLARVTSAASRLTDSIFVAKKKFDEK